MTITSTTVAPQVAINDIGSTEDFLAAIDATIKNFDDGDIVEGTIVKVDRDEVLLDIGYKTEGVIPSRELSIKHDVDPNEVVSVGDTVEALVLQKEDKEGRLILSKKRAQYERAWGTIEKIKEEDGVVTGKVIEVVKGGLILDIGLRGFLPASLVEMRRVRDLQPYVGREIEAKIIELDKNRNNVVLSRRAWLEQTQSEVRTSFLSQLQRGQIRNGVVSSIVNFGAFVDLGGVDGLVHVSELSWKHIDHPSEVVSVGDEVTVEVLDVELDRERVSLSLKATQEDPWQHFARTHQMGQVVPGKVTKLVPFGAFVRVEEGIEGLVHISELAERHVEIPEQVVTVNDDIFVKVIDIDLERRRISLSLKQANENASGAAAEEFDPYLYGMAPSYDEAGVYIGPEGFDPETGEWKVGFEDQRAAWEAQYAEAHARWEQHMKQVEDAKQADQAAALETGERCGLLQLGRSGRHRRRGHPRDRRGPAGLAREADRRRLTPARPGFHPGQIDRPPARQGGGPIAARPGATGPPTSGCHSQGVGIGSLGGAEGSAPTRGWWATPAGPDQAAQGDGPGGARRAQGQGMDGRAQGDAEHDEEPHAAPQQQGRASVVSRHPGVEQHLHDAEPGSGQGKDPDVARNREELRPRHDPYDEIGHQRHHQGREQPEPGHRGHRLSLRVARSCDHPGECGHQDRGRQEEHGPSDQGTGCVEAGFVRGQPRASQQHVEIGQRVEGDERVGGVEHLAQEAPGLTLLCHPRTAGRRAGTARPRRRAERPAPRPEGPHRQSARSPLPRSPPPPERQWTPRRAPPDAHVARSPGAGPAARR